MKLTIPKSLADIKLSQYQRFIKETKGIEDEEQIKVKTITIFCKIPQQDYKKLTLPQIANALEQINKLFETKPPLQTIIKHNGKKYGFIPNDFKDLTFGEFTDIDTYLKDISTYHKAMKVLYRPVYFTKGSQYVIEDYDASAEDLDLSIDIVFGCIGFFLTLLSDLLNCTQKYIQGQVVQDEKLWNLVKNGVGINHFTLLLREMYLSSKKLVS